MSQVSTFRPLLMLQWKVSKWAVVVLLPLLVGLPIAVVNFGERFATGPFANPALDMIRAMDIWSPVFPVLAALTGATFGLLAWLWDHNTKHVYALTLPIERWRYALLKTAAGTLMLLIPTVGLLIGALIATSTADIPDGLRAYPASFAFRFFFAALIIYAILFALAAGTVRTTVRILLVLALVVGLGSIVTSSLSSSMDRDIPSPLTMIVIALARWPGPFNVFGGNWNLIDV